jgi:hypothetical protein
VRQFGSILVACLAWLAAILTAIVTVALVPHLFQKNIDPWTGFAFTFGGALPLGIGTFLLAMIPGMALYSKWKRRRDLIIALVSGTVLAVLFVETVWIQSIPRHGE